MICEKCGDNEALLDEIWCGSCIDEWIDQVVKEYEEQQDMYERTTRVEDLP